jgi:hypothetical protein
MVLRSFTAPLCTWKDTALSTGGTPSQWYDSF